MKYLKTFWEAEIDGKTKKVTIQDVIKHLDYVNSEVIEIDINELKSLSIFKKSITKETLNRIESSDTSYPIIVSKLNGRYNRIIDGNHRLQKAIMNNKKIIKARVLLLNNAPDTFYELFK
jgi:hypothetical protein